MPYSFARNPAPIDKTKQGGKIPSASVNTTIVALKTIASVATTGVKANITTNVSAVRIANVVVNSINTNKNKTH